MILALAGRRIDAVDAQQPRFPLAAMPAVRRRIAALLREKRPSALVCSAACGVDLIALDLAGAAGIERRIVLPFRADRFRETSVTDRPGPWGELFDRILAEVEQQGGLVFVNGEENNSGYTAVNRSILDTAEEIAFSRGTMVEAAAAWDGRPRGKDDLTGSFRQDAISRRIPVTEIDTLQP